MKNRVVTIVAVIVAAVVVVAAGAYLAMQGPSARTIELQASEFFYRGLGHTEAKGGPTITVKSGETVRIVFRTIGGAPHEFMVVQDKDMAASMMKDVIQKIQAKGIGREEAMEEYEEEHEKMMPDMVAFKGAVVDAKPGESKTIEFKADKAGKYWYVCLEADLTYPELHSDRGMFWEFIVEG